MTNFIDIGTKIENTDGLITAQLQIPGDAIWFDGHFPGAAVLPGIAQLGMIIEILEKTLDKSVRVLGVNRVRFKQTIKPENPIVIQISPKDNTQTFAFRLLTNGELACSGFIKVAFQASGSEKN